MQCKMEWNGEDSLDIYIYVCILAYTGVDGEKRGRGVFRGAKCIVSPEVGVWCVFLIYRERGV